MSVDRGGLQYSINIDGNYRKSLQEFRSGISEAKRSLDSLKGRGSGSPSRRLSSDQRAALSNESLIARAKERNAVELGKVEQREARNRISRLRESLRARKGLEVGGETDIARARERVAIAARRREEREQAATARRLKKNIQERQAAQVQAEQQIARARERAAISTQKAAQKEEQARIRQNRDAAKRTFAPTEDDLRKQKALTQINRVLGEQALLQEKVNAINAKGVRLTEQQARTLGVGLGDRGQAVLPNSAPARQTLKQRIADFLGISKSADQAEGSVNRIAFTFRRLFGILAAFTIARQVAAGTFGLIRDMIKFNAQLEQSQLGIASVLLAVGEVRDATGQTVVASQGLAIAQGEARRQTELLRKDAVRTAATFTDLLTTFQVAIAPGIESGLNIDEIRRFTVQISQAASAIGLEQNQLAEEIRSILTGTIAARTTRIATALGINNEDIRIAREAGVLFEFLQKRFEAFSVAGDESLNNFNTILSNIRDTFQLILSSGGLDFFNKLKALLKDVLDSMATLNPLTGVIEPNPRIVQIIQAFASGLGVVVDEVSRLRIALTFDDVLTMFRALGQAIGFAGRIAGRFIEGAVKGLGDVSRIVKVVVRTFQDLTGIKLFDNAVLNDTVILLVRFTTLLVGLSLVLAPFKFFVFTLLPKALFGINKLIVAFNALVASTAPLIVAIRSILVAFISFEIGRFLFDEFKIVQEIAAVAISLFEKLWTTIITGAKLAGKSLKVVAQGFDLGGVVVGVAIARKIVGVEAPEGEGGIADDFSAILSEHKSEFDKINDDLSKRFIEIEKDFKGQDRKGGNFLDFVRKDIESVTDKLFGAKAAANDFLNEGNEGAQTLSRTLLNLPGIITQSREPLTQNAKIVKQMRDELERVKDSLRFGTDSLGLTGGVLELRRASFDAMVDIRERTKVLDDEEKASLKESADLTLQRISIESRLSRLTTEQRVAVQRGVEAARRLADVQRQIAESENEVQIKKLALEKTSREGNDETVATAWVGHSAAVATNHVLKARLVTEQGIADSILDGFDDASSLVDLISARVQLGGLEVAQAEHLAAIRRDRVGIEKQVNEQLAGRITLLARQQAFEAQQEIRRATVDLENLREISTARRPGAPREALDLADRKADVRLLQLAVSEAEQSRRTEEDKLKLTLQEAQARQASLAAEVAMSGGLSLNAKLLQQMASEARTLTDLEELQNVTLQKNNIHREIERIQQQEALADLERARLIVEKPVQAGILVALENLDISRFEATLRTMENLVSSFADFASSAIADAFDPSKDVDIRERFRLLLVGIGQDILRMFFQAAAVKAALGLSGIFGGFNAGGEVKGFNRGGPVPHAKAKGYARGGRPSGLHPSDTIPIWTAPGEWVIRRSSAGMYGSGVMSAINDGLIDPTSLQALASVSSASKSKSSPRLGYADGGRINVPASSPASSPSGPTLAVIAPSEENVGRLLRGGRAEVLRFFEDNADALNSILGQRS